MLVSELKPMTIIEEVDGRKWLVDSNFIEELDYHCVDCREQIPRGKVRSFGDFAEPSYTKILEDELFKEGEFKIISQPVH